MLDIKYGGVAMAKPFKKEDRTSKIADGWRLLAGLGIIDDDEANREIRALEPPLFMPNMLEVTDPDTYVWWFGPAPLPASPTNPSPVSIFCCRTSR